MPFVFNLKPLFLFVCICLIVGCKGNGGSSTGGGSSSSSSGSVDTTPPEAVVVFPTPTTLSDGATVTLRGKATDDLGPVTSIAVTVTTDSGATAVDSQTLTAGDNDNFISTWSVQVDLAADTLNTIDVTATDAAGNTQTTPTQLTILQTDQETNFPEGNDVYIGEMSGNGIDIDTANNRILVPGFEQENIFSVDITTGVRSEFIGVNAELTEPLRTALVDAQNNRVFFGETTQLNVADLDSGEFSLVTDNTNAESDVDLAEIDGMDLHSQNGLLYAADGINGLYSINTDTGARSLVSGTDRPIGGENPFQVMVDVILDEENNRALVSDGNADKLFWVDLTSGERTVFVESPNVDAPYHMDHDEDDSRAVFVNNDTNQILQVNLSSGVVSVVSDSTIPEMGANQFLVPYSLAIDSENNIVYLLATRLFETTTWLYVIDINTGERVVLTRSVSPSP